MSPSPWVMNVVSIVLWCEGWRRFCESNVLVPLFSIICQVKTPQEHDIVDHATSRGRVVVSLRVIGRFGTDPH